MAKTRNLMALENTSTHCKGVYYNLPETEAKEGIEKGLFIDMATKKPEPQKEIEKP